MHLADRITTLLGLLRESSPEGRRSRRRLGAAGGVATLVTGFLAAVGLGNVVEIGVAAAALALVLAVGIAAAPRFWRAIRAAFRSRWINEASVRSARARHAVMKLPGSALARTRAGAGRTRRLGRSATAHGGARLRRLIAACSGSVIRAVRRLERARPPAIHAPPAPAALPAANVHRQDDALRLNAAGVRLRREGSPSEAAEQHRAALGILRELGDDRSVALTLNNLALALSHVGDDAAAVELFHQAAAILGGLGDEQHEGQVIANLGLAHRRHGRGEEADNVLQLALAKLAPASSEYRTVEAELRRAS